VEITEERLAEEAVVDPACRREGLSLRAPEEEEVRRGRGGREGGGARRR